MVFEHNGLLSSLNIFGEKVQLLVDFIVLNVIGQLCGNIKGDSFSSSSWWWLCLENFVFVKCLVSNAKSWQRTPSVESARGLSYLYFIMMA